jgi:hypothetical protein
MEIFITGTHRKPLLDFVFPWLLNPTGIKVTVTGLIILMVEP